MKKINCKVSRLGVNLEENNSLNNNLNYFVNQNTLISKESIDLKDSSSNKLNNNCILDTTIKTHVDIDKNIINKDNININNFFNYSYNGDNLLPNNNLINKYQITNKYSNNINNTSFSINGKTCNDNNACNNDLNNIIFFNGNQLNCINSHFNNNNNNIKNFVYNNFKKNISFNNSNNIIINSCNQINKINTVNNPNLLNFNNTIQNLSGDFNNNNNLNNIKDYKDDYYFNKLDSNNIYSLSLKKHIHDKNLYLDNNTNDINTNNSLIKYSNNSNSYKSNSISNIKNYINNNAHDDKHYYKKMSNILESISNDNYNLYICKNINNKNIFNNYSDSYNKKHYNNLKNKPAFKKVKQLTKINSLLTLECYINSNYKNNKELTDFICTLSGCKKFQLLLYNFNNEMILYLINYIGTSISIIAKNQYANYFFQNLCCNSYKDERLMIIKNLSNDFVDIACNLRGTHSLQALIDTVNSKEEIDLLIEIIKKDFLVLAMVSTYYKYCNNIIKGF